MSIVSQISNFLEVFNEEYAPLLAFREPTFRFCFEHLPGYPIVFETGCINDKDNWRGHGQSTVMFDRLAAMCGGKLYSVDTDPEAVALARYWCDCIRTQVCCGDSVEFLKSYRNEPIDLLYLDSFDLDPADPLPAAEHGLRELEAAWPHLKPHAIVCVDDTYMDNGALTGKGMLVAKQMELQGIKKVMQHYQAVWVL